MLDMEFLQDEHTKRRVAAFGFYAGFNGSAVGILALGSTLSGEGRLKELKPFKDEEQLIARGKSELERVVAKLGRHPKALVIGALGRCGSGAVTFFKKIGMNKFVLNSSPFPSSKRTGIRENVADLFLCTKPPSGKTLLNGIWPRRRKEGRSRKS